MLRAENITKSYDKGEAVKGITLHVAPGEVLAILGPSGSGKTTLLRLIAGFERPDAGIVSIEGVDVSSPMKIIAPSKRNLSMIFQDLALWPHMTVRQHIEFVLKKDKLPKNVLNSKITTILNHVRLNGHHSRYPHELSGGEKQRLAIARALDSLAKYLLMDEPFSNLDSILKEELQDLVIELKNRLQMGIIYVTHNIEEALALADTIGVMHQGKLEQIDSKDKILVNPKNEFVRRLLKIR
jgi:iron(III) transport system ATP-binding protein